MAELPIPEHYSAEDLRAEAKRREVEAKAIAHAKRQEARHRVLDGLLAIRRADLDQASAWHPVEVAVQAVIKAEIDDAGVTNGEVNLAGSHEWWNEVRRRVPHVDDHPEVLHVRRGGHVRFSREATDG